MAATASRQPGAEMTFSRRDFLKTGLTLDQRTVPQDWLNYNGHMAILQMTRRPARTTTPSQPLQTASIDRITTRIQPALEKLTGHARPA